MMMLLRKFANEFLVPLGTTFSLLFATTSIVFLLLGFYGFFEYIYNRPKTEKFEVLIEVE